MGFALVGVERNALPSMIILSVVLDMRVNERV